MQRQTFGEWGGGIEDSAYYCYCAHVLCIPQGMVTLQARTRVHEILLRFKAKYLEKMPLFFVDSNGCCKDLLFSAWP